MYNKETIINLRSWGKSTEAYKYKFSFSKNKESKAANFTNPIFKNYK